ncbi:hypothetical protein AMAG_13698 [Allomyces macrogynus ATCC 38327]|uniref:Cytochrome b561 domain-containing protein n=1 Tax=Allomyces macrogynus (strain ATCC 38327) TaxID=578462 RepID=A0A0L0T3Q1_ALLM3|nr:hypothetical protein AMAG_13698 [Allomyces macrogynus ATCC 38327]|eukprot:KNE69325.1 hypothetical protein AMAG_13698 [Allomyces macrogynus ATCC 38327]
MLAIIMTMTMMLFSLAGSALASDPAPAPAASIAKCVQDRALCMSAAANTTHVDVTVTFPAAMGWVSVGLSPSQSMSLADVWMIWIQNTTTGPVAQVSDRLSTGASTPKADGKQDVDVVRAQTTGDKYTVTVRRRIDTGDKDDLPFENKEQGFIWAMGSTPVRLVNRVPEFDRHTSRGGFMYNALAATMSGDVPSVAAAPDPQQAVDADAGSMSRTTVVLVHAVCMVVAWGLLTNVAIYVVAFLKGTLGDKWFKVHWGIMAVVALLNIVGFVVVVINSARHFSSPHGILGLVVFSLLWAQILLGIVIDRLYDPTRGAAPIRDKVHWVIGYLLALAAPANIALGLIQYEAGWTWLGAFAGLFVVTLLVFAAGALRQTKTKPSTLPKSALPSEKPSARSIPPPTTRPASQPSRPHRPPDLHLGDLSNPSPTARGFSSPSRDLDSPSRTPSRGIDTPRSYPSTVRSGSTPSGSGDPRTPRADTPRGPHPSTPSSLRPPRPTTDDDGYFSSGDRRRRPSAAQLIPDAGVPGTPRARSRSPGTDGVPTHRRTGSTDPAAGGRPLPSPRSPAFSNPNRAPRPSADGQYANPNRAPRPSLDQQPSTPHGLRPSVDGQYANPNRAGRPSVDAQYANPNRAGRPSVDQPAYVSAGRPPRPSVDRGVYNPGRPDERERRPSADRRVEGASPVRPRRY